MCCAKELMQKGYGMGSGISLFIATNICESRSRANERSDSRDFPLSSLVGMLCQLMLVFRA